MRYDRISSIDNLGVVAAFVKHANIKTKYIGEVNSTVGTTLVRADDHHMVTVNPQIFFYTQKTLDKLVCWRNGLKAVQRDRILYARVMRVKGDNIIHAHIDEFLKSDCAVQ